MGCVERWWVFLLAFHPSSQRDVRSEQGGGDRTALVVGGLEPAEAEWIAILKEMPLRTKAIVVLL